MTTGLLIVDVQNDYFPQGRMELCGASEAGEALREILQDFRRRKQPIIHIRHIALRPNATFFLPNTSGAEIHSSVAPQAEEKVIIKNYPNSFHKTELQQYLLDHKIETLVIGGMMTHMCIDTTVRAAYDLGYKNIVISDCCATKDLQFQGQLIPADQVQAAFLAALQGTFANILTKEAFLTGGKS